MLIPPALRPGDTLGLVSPAGATFEADAFDIAVESLHVLGFRVKTGRHLKARYGHFAGRDAERAEDLNAMFADPEVKGIIAMRGGSGCGRILPLLDYDLIARNPKALVGFSDITSLLLAIYTKTGLVTFHGPTGSSPWNKFTTEHFLKVLMHSGEVLLQNPVSVGDQLVQTQDRICTVWPGKAQGVLVGGNLAVLTAVIGTPYVPEWTGKLLFLEEINEEIYRVDRMMSQLKLAGVFEKVSGVVLGKFTNCSHGERFASLTLDEVFQDYFGSLGIPVFSGAMIGHIPNKFTVPVGLSAEMDAAAGTIRFLNAVK